MLMTLYWVSDSEEERSKSRGEKFDDKIFKLMNKAFYGKTKENKYNIQNVELVNDLDSYFKIV